MKYGNNITTNNVVTNKFITDFFISLDLNQKINDVDKIMVKARIFGKLRKEIIIITISLISFIKNYTLVSYRAYHCHHTDQIVLLFPRRYLLQAANQIHRRMSMRFLVE